MFYSYLVTWFILLFKQYFAIIGCDKSYFGGVTH